jgi:hypothetical protein
MQRLEFSGALRHIYIYIYMSLGGKGLITVFRGLSLTHCVCPYQETKWRLFFFADVATQFKSEQQLTSPKSITDLPEKLLTSGIHLPGMLDICLTNYVEQS